MSITLYRYDYQDVRQLVESFLLKIGKRNDEKEQLIGDGYLKCLSGALGTDITSNVLDYDDTMGRSLFSDADIDSAVESMGVLLTDLFGEHNLEMKKDDQSLVKESCGDLRDSLSRIKRIRDSSIDTYCLYRVEFVNHKGVGNPLNVYAQNNTELVLFHQQSNKVWRVCGGEEYRLCDSDETPVLSPLMCAMANDYLFSSYFAGIDGEKLSDLVLGTARTSCPERVRVGDAFECQELWSPLLTIENGLISILPTFDDTNLTNREYQFIGGTAALACCSTYDPKSVLDEIKEDDGFVDYSHYIDSSYDDRKRPTFTAISILTHNIIKNGMPSLKKETPSFLALQFMHHNPHIELVMLAAHKMWGLEGYHESTYELSFHDNVELETEFLGVDCISTKTELDLTSVLPIFGDKHSMSLVDFLSSHKNIQLLADEDVPDRLKRPLDHEDLMYEMRLLVGEKSGEMVYYRMPIDMEFDRDNIKDSATDLALKLTLNDLIAMNSGFVVESFDDLGNYGLHDHLPQYFKGRMDDSGQYQGVEWDGNDPIDLLIGVNSDSFSPIMHQLKRMDYLPRLNVRSSYYDDLIKETKTPSIVTDLIRKEIDKLIESECNDLPFEDIQKELIFAVKGYDYNEYTNAVEALAVETCGDWVVRVESPVVRDSFHQVRRHYLGRI